MNIEFINHASVMMRSKNIALITDPWLSGSVFQDGWSLLVPSKFQSTDWMQVTHIWFSHEHPDHFHPRTLFQIPEDQRKKITILYQKTSDKKVINFCKKIGFKKVIELKPLKWTSIGGGVSMICGQVDHDSWSALRVNGKTALNTNDCVIKKSDVAESIKQVVGNVTVLLTQFSYGQYEGGRDQPELREAAVERKFLQMKNQIDVFKPQYFIPFASFVWFSHEENVYMNDKVNRVGRVYDFFSNYNNLNTIVMYPGDRWDLGDNSYNSERAIESYEEHYRKLESAVPLKKTQSTTIQDLKNASINFFQRISDTAFPDNFINYDIKLNIYISDLNVYGVLTPSSFDIDKLAKEPVDVEITSDGLNFCFNTNWGFNTTRVNGRFQLLTANALKKYSHIEKIANYMNHGSLPVNASRTQDSIFMSLNRKIKNKVTALASKF